MARIIELLMPKGGIACDLAFNHAESVILVLRASAVNRTIPSFGSSLRLATIEEETGIR
jgi:hypothetical protein